MIRYFNVNATWRRSSAWALGGLLTTVPYVINLGPARFRRWLLDFLPISRVQRLKGAVDIMDEQSKRIISEKRSALQKGDEAMLQQIGEGKDIISVLRACSTSHSSGVFADLNTSIWK